MNLSKKKRKKKSLILISDYIFKTLPLFIIIYPLKSQVFFLKHSQTCSCGHHYLAVTCIKRSPFSCHRKFHMNWTCFKRPLFLCPKGGLLIHVRLYKCSDFLVWWVTIHLVRHGSMVRLYKCSDFFVWWVIIHLTRHGSISVYCWLQF